MRFFIKKQTRSAWGMALLVFALAALAPAEAMAASLRPPLPGQVDAPPLWLYYLILIVLTGATVALSILPSKRGHQD